VLERLERAFARPAEEKEGRPPVPIADHKSLSASVILTDDQFRIDGRGITDIRALSAEVAVAAGAWHSAVVRAR